MKRDAPAMTRPLCIVLEGAEGAGKTLLANQLKNDLGLFYHHEGPPSDGMMGEDLFRYYLDPVLQATHNTVFDRMGFGEFVYGPIYRSMSRMDAKLIDAYLHAVNACAIHVLCHPPITRVVDTWIEGRQKKGLSDIVRAWAAFNEARYSFPQLYDYTREGEYARLLKYIRARHEDIKNVRRV